jgi:acid phosphatase (class A)
LDPVLVLPPPPAAGSDAAAEDLAVFKATRALDGSARWALAARDAVNYVGAFDCALGVALSPTATPRTFALLRRVGADAAVLTNAAKDHYGRPRPLASHEGPICVESQRSALLKSASYPSGHATYGWAVGLILAELAPDRASALLARARAFGESRVVCGVHYVSDIDEGRTNGALLVAALHGDPAFRRDLDAARSELTAALTLAAAKRPDPQECAVESEASVHTPWVNPTTAK